MTIPKELTTALREFLRHHRKSCRSFSRHTTEKDDVARFLKKNRRVKASVDRAKKDIAELEAKIKLAEKRISRYGIDPDGRYLRNEELFVKAGGELTPQPPHFPDYSEVVAKLAGAKTAAEATKVLSDIGFVWTL